MEFHKTECRTCRRELEEGTNVLEVHEGIIGKLGFVTLGEKLLFCNFDCLRGDLRIRRSRLEATHSVDR